MNVHEWPLTLFTVLAQMAVGAFVTLGFIQVLARPVFGSKAVDRIANPALYAIGPLMVFGLAGSVFHLGNPLNAPNAILHVGSSWLSREILFGAGFAGLGFAFAVTQWMHWFTPVLRSLLAGITALWGVAFIFVMAKVYMIRTIPAWDTWTTPASFYLTAGLLGVLSMGMALSFYPVARTMPKLDRLTVGKDPDILSADHDTVQRLIYNVLRWIGVVALVLLVGQLIVTVFSYGQPAGVNPPVMAFPEGMFILRLALLALGAGLLGVYVSMQANRGPGATKNLVGSGRLFGIATMSLLLVLASEIVGRFIFYGTMNRIGI